ncbi:fumarylacetoacetate hydrolase family protein [Pseudonocardia sp. NPDC049635]|uniref:2-keto-4-pentenoate hydratase n=1 Tax=Pseudonocardia sp. NPDC049635 TaxID=3155506 RepID=UPI0033FD0B03
MTESTRPAVIAAELDAARREARDIQQFAGRVEITLADAYAVLLEGISLRRERGEQVLGLKLGFTSKEKAAQMGVSDVILGVLTDGMAVSVGGELDHGLLIHPRVEPEIAFRLAGDVSSEDLAGAEGTVAHATHVAAALEVIDSRYRDFSFSLEDVVADNTSASYYVIGEWHEMTDAMRAGDMADLAVELRIDREVVASGSTRAILGDPLEALRAAARLAGQYGHPLEPGHVVLAGAATAAVPLPAGSDVEVHVDTLGTAALRTTSRPEVR